MIKEIGSTFWLSPDLDYSERHTISLEQFKLKGKDWVFLSTGRSCIKLAIETSLENNFLRTKTVVVPSFTCYTCTLPFENYGFKIVPLHVSKDLTTSPEMLKKTVLESNASMVLLHQYFGFETIKSSVPVIEELRDRGVVIIEDRTQCLYSSFPPLPADFYVASMRKWAGLPDGGIAVYSEGVFSKKVNKRNTEFEKVKIQASVAKYDYIFNGVGKKEYFRNLYEKAADMLAAEKEYYLINDSSTCVQQNLNVNDLKEKRIDNYRYLFMKLKELKVFKSMFNPSNIEVPLYYPLKTNGYREGLQKHLASKNIYAPVIWPNEINIIVDADATYLYNDLLCIPIDQRYGLDDMERIAREIICFDRSIS